MSDNKSVLIVVEVTTDAPSPFTAELFGAAQSAGGHISAVAIGSGAKTIVPLLGSLGATTVYIGEIAEPMETAAGSIIMNLAKKIKPRMILLADDDLGRDLAPLLAARLNTAAVTGAATLRRDGEKVIITRPVYGGNALADFTIETEPQIITIRPKAFTPTAPDDTRKAEVVELPLTGPSSDIKNIERVVRKEEGPKIEDAKVVIGGGRGVGGPESFAQLKQLADLLGGVVGASRPPCDQGWWPESGQIGVTGKIIAPELYIAVGISGSSQHISGVSGAKTIVAINKDAEANIFKTAAYGVIGDWKKIVPALIAKVKELTGR